MADIELDETEQEENNNSYHLLDIINAHFDILYAFKEIDFSPLYDKGEEDKIKCIAGCYKVIQIAQNAIIEQIKRET